MKFFYQSERNNRLRLHITQSLTYDAHIHESLEIIYLEKGTAHAFVGEKDYTLSAGDFFVVFPNAVHYYDNCSNNLAIVVTVPLHILPEFRDILTTKTLISPLFQDIDGSAVNLIKTLSDYKGNYKSEANRGLILAVFSMIMDKAELTDKKVVDETAVGEILAFCENNYKEKLSLKILSENLKISQSHISHIFANKIHMNLRDYINSLRINTALQLLRQGKTNITQAALDCGFDSIRTFNRAFKKKYGVPPKEYMKSNLL